MSTLIIEITKFFYFLIIQHIVSFKDNLGYLSIKLDITRTTTPKDIQILHFGPSLVEYIFLFLFHSKLIPPSCSSSISSPYLSVPTTNCSNKHRPNRLIWNNHPSTTGHDNSKQAAKMDLCI